MIRKNCEYCGRFFWTYSYRVKKGRGKYCSHECCSKNMSKEQVVSCDNCGDKTKKKLYKIKENKHNFCNRSCKHEFMKKGRVFSCDNCGHDVYRSPKEIKRNNSVFCDHNCYTEYNTKYPKTADLRRKIQSRINNKKYRKELSEHYIMQLLHQNHDVKRENIPKALIGVKAEQLKVKRKIKSVKQ